MNDASVPWVRRALASNSGVLIAALVFAVLLGLIIISFVFTIGAAPGIGQAERASLKREFFGYNLGSTVDQERLMGDAGLSANLQMGAFGNLEAEQIQNYAFQRAASLHLADAWHLPPATDAELQKQIEGLRMFAGQDGQFDPKAYATFRDNLKTNPRGVNEADIARVIRAVQQTGADMEIILEPDGRIRIAPRARTEAAPAEYKGVIRL